MKLTSSQRRYLRGLAHDLKPVIMVGAKGLTPSLVAELEAALDHHELVKVKVATDDREAFAEAAEQLATSAKAEKVQTIGRTVVLYRRNADEPRLALPK
jgi:RNA-binding protein